MKKARISLVSSMLRFLVAGCWIIVLLTDFYDRPTSTYLIIVHAIIALFFLSAAIFQLALYKKQRDGNETPSVRQRDAQ